MNQIKLRLEARAFGSSLTPEEAQAKLQFRIARAARQRLQSKHNISKRASSQVQRALRIVSEHTDYLDHSGRKALENLEVRHAQASERRDAAREANLRHCRARQVKVEAVLRRRREKHLKVRHRVAETTLQATARRNTHVKTMMDKLGRHLQTVEGKKVKVQSTKRIQRWFREKQTMASALTALGLNVNVTEMTTVAALFAKLETVSFEDAMKCLTEPSVSQAARRVLTLIPVSAPIRLRPRRLRTARVFLMAGMIAYHASDVLSARLDPNDEMADDAQTEDEIAVFKHFSERLLHAATLMVDATHELALAMVSASATSPSSSEMTRDTLKRALRTFDASHTLFLDAFDAWKRLDGQRLASDLVQSYAMLFSANYTTTLEHGDAAAEDRIHEIMRRTVDQMAELKHAMVKVLGREATDVRLAALRTQLTTQLDAKFAAASDKEKTAASRRQARQAKATRRAASPSKPDLGFTKQVFSNEQLAHELILNPQYKLEAPPADTHPAASLVTRVTSTMKQVFWDELTTALSETRGASSTQGPTRLLRQLEEMREALLGVLGATTSDFASVKTTLSTEVLTRQMGLDSSSSSSSSTAEMAPGMLHWPQLCQTLTFVLGMLLRNEAPVRNADTSAWQLKLGTVASVSPFVPSAAIALLPSFFTFVLTQIDYFRLDSVNAHLQLLAPYLARHGIEHERTKFTAMLEAAASRDDDGLDATSQWITRSLLPYEARLTAPRRTLLHAGNAVEFKRFLRAAFMALITSTIEGRAEEVWPETYGMDVDRFRHYRDTIDRLTLQASFVTLVKQSLGMVSIGYPVARALAFKATLDVLLNDPTIQGTDLAAQVVAEAVAVATEAHVPLTDTAQKVLQGQVASVMEPGNPIFKVFFTRCVTGLGRRLEMACEKEIESDTSTSVSPVGLEAFESELTALFDQANRLVCHNEAVHATHYNRLIQIALSSHSAVEMD